MCINCFQSEEVILSWLYVVSVWKKMLFGIISFVSASEKPKGTGNYFQMAINPYKVHILYNAAHKIIHKHLFIKIYAYKNAFVPAT